MPEALLDQASQLGIQPRTSFFDPTEAGSLVARYAGQERELRAAQQMAAQLRQTESTRHALLANQREEETWNREDRDRQAQDEYNMQRGRFYRDLSQKLNPSDADYLKNRNEFLANLPQEAMNDETLKWIVRSSDEEHAKSLADKLRDEDRQQAIKEHYATSVLPFIRDPQRRAVLEAALANPAIPSTELYKFAYEAEVGKQEVRAEEQAKKAQAHKWQESARMSARQRDADDNLINSANRQAGGLPPSIQAEVMDLNEGPALLAKRLESALKTTGVSPDDAAEAFDQNQDWQGFADQVASSEAWIKSTGETDPAKAEELKRQRNHAKMLYAVLSGIKTNNQLRKNDERYQKELRDVYSAIDDEYGVVPTPPDPGNVAPPPKAPTSQDMQKADDWSKNVLPTLLK